MGYGGAFNFVDGLLKLDLFKNFDLSPSVTPRRSDGERAGRTRRCPFRPTRFSCPSSGQGDRDGGRGNRLVSQPVRRRQRVHRCSRKARRWTVRLACCRRGKSCRRAYLRAEASIGGVRPIIGTRSQIHLRLYGGIAQRRAGAAGGVRVEPGSIRDVQQRSVSSAGRLAQAARCQLSPARRGGPARVSVSTFRSSVSRRGTSSWCSG